MLISKYINNKAFTLAEVLITLLIIGVVASLTIPAIIADTEKAETATQVKKYQSVISQAVMNIKNEYGSIINSPLNSNSSVTTEWNALKSKLNIVKDCGILAGQGCWANVMSKYLYGTDAKNWDLYTSGGKGILQDGSSICLEAGSNCSSNVSSNNSGPLYNTMCAEVCIDVNGIKAPNQSGRDIFCWYILQNGTVYPVGSLDDVRRGCDPTSSDVSYGTNGSPGRGTGCTSRVIKEGKIDY
jgi:prepilin-type N-terminal cleavage/methylation domain-containing protein